MNWKRGLLRLWAAAAVLWVGVAFYSNDTVRRVQDAHAFSTKINLPMNFDVSGAKKVGYSDGEISTYLAKEKDFDFLGARRIGYSDVEIIGYLSAVKIPPKRNSAPISHFNSQKSIWPPLSDFAKLAFIPPLLLLALGYIGLWVGRGFRR